MKTMRTTKMSSKGQVVIPEDIRKAMNLEKGVQFAVISEGDVILLKLLTPPSLDQFNALISKARSQAKKAGFQRKDLKSAIKKARK